MDRTLLKTVLLILFITVIVYCGILVKGVSNYITNKQTVAVSADAESAAASDVETINLYGKNIPYNVSELDLSNATIDDLLITKFMKFPKLKKVILKNQDLSARQQKALEKAYSDIDFVWDVKVLDKKVDSKTKKLDLTKSNVKNIKEFKKEISLLHKLKYLDMSDCNLSNEQLAKLRKELPKIKIVWKVYLGKWSLKTDAVSFSVLVAYFDYRRMTSSDIQVLKYCTDLQALDLGHQNITDISVIGEYLPNLRVLILADNKISDIKPLSKLKHLHYLELFMNNIRDISPLKKCKELVDLNLAHIPTLYDFSPLLDNKFPLLERLCMQNSGGTYKYYNAIRQKYPKVRIVYTGYGSTHSGWRTHERYFAMIDMFHKRDYISKSFTKYDR